MFTIRDAIDRSPSPIPQQLRAEHIGILERCRDKWLSPPATLGSAAATHSSSSATTTLGRADSTHFSSTAASQATASARSTVAAKQELKAIKCGHGVYKIQILNPYEANMYLAAVMNQTKIVNLDNLIDDESKKLLVKAFIKFHEEYPSAAGSLELRGTKIERIIEEVNQDRPRLGP